MKNVIFLIWLLCFPIVCQIEKYIFFKLRGETATEGAKGFAGMVELAIYLIVAYFLFER